jgi:hypothetical protein
MKPKHTLTFVVPLCIAAALLAATEGTAGATHASHGLRVDRAKGGIDGAYRARTTLSQLQAVAGLEERNPSNYGTYRTIFDRGRFVITQSNSVACTWQYGKYRIAGSRLTLAFTSGGGVGTDGYNRAGDTFTFTWKLSGSRLVLGTASGGISPAPFRISPWTRASKTPRWMWLGTGHCAPPKSALPH